MLSTVITGEVGGEEEVGVEVGDVEEGKAEAEQPKEGSWIIEYTTIISESVI